MIGLVDIRLEQSILGIALLSPVVIERLADQVRAEHFGEPQHAATWTAILDTWHDTTTVEVVSVARRLTPSMRDAGEAHNWVDSLTAEACDTHALADTVRELQRLALRRSWRQASWKLAQAADTDDESHVQTAEQLLRTEVKEHEPTAQEDVFEWLSDDQPAGITTGFPGIDTLIGGGLRPGDVTSLGGWTGMGKSVVCDGILTAAVEQGRTAHLLMNEMSKRDRRLRLIAADSLVPFERLAVKDIRAGEHERIMRSASNLPFDMTDCSSWTVERIARHIRTHRWDVVALDVLHNMPLRDTRELDAAVAMLLGAARTSGSHLILICHLNEERAKTTLLPRPVVRDIRGSGMVKNVSSTVLMLHRDQSSEGGYVTTLPDGLLTVEKARHGRLGAACVRLDADRMRFVDMTPPMRSAA